MAAGRERFHSALVAEATYLRFTPVQTQVSSLKFSTLPQPMSYPLWSARGREHIHRSPLPRAALRRRPLNRTAHGRIAGHRATLIRSGEFERSAALMFQELQRLDVFGPVNSQSNHSIKMGVGRSNVVQTEPSGDGKIERIVGQ